MIDHAEELTALDQAIGDGDHGINMKRGLEAVLADLPSSRGQPLGRGAEGRRHEARHEGRRRLGAALRNARDGTRKARPGFAVARRLGGGAAAAIEAVKARGKSDVGQKTMLDVLVPVQAELAGGCGRRQGEALDAAEATRRSGRPAAAPRSSASAPSGTWIRARARRRSWSRPCATRWRSEAWRRMWAS